MRSTPRTASRRETGAIGKILLLGRRAKLESGAAPLFFEQPLAVVDNDGNQENVTRFDTSRTERDIGPRADFSAAVFASARRCSATMNAEYGMGEGRNRFCDGFKRLKSRLTSIPRRLCAASITRILNMGNYFRTSAEMGFSGR